MIAQGIRWSLANRLFVIVGALLLMLWGGIEASRMSVDVFPDLTAPTVTILADTHGMAPEEMENLVTLPIETAMNGAAGVRRIRSSTTVGAAVIWVEFDWGTDIYRARQVVAERLQLARASLPLDMPAPTLAPISSIMGEIMYLSVSSDRHNAMEVKTAADWVVRRRLLAVPGVAQVTPIGGDTRQYQVLVHPDRLAAYGIALDQLTQALAQSNENTSAGFYSENGQEYLIYGLGRIERLSDIGETVVTRIDGVPITIADLAEVDIGPAFKRGTASANGKDAVVLAVQKQPNANTLELTERLDETAAQLEAVLPEGMRIDTTLFRQADFIEVAIENVTAALRDGALLVVAIVFVFLFSTRATFITVLAIPLSLVTAVLAMKAMGANINTMTLGGMAIAVGALVDDAIIGVENIVRRLRQNAQRPEHARKPVLNVVFDATHEIQGSIVFATLIIMLVFVPLFFLSGVEGRLLAPLGFAYVVSLAASLLVAVTVTPVLASLLLPSSPDVLSHGETRLARWIKARYRPWLTWALDHWRTVAVGAFSLFVVAMTSLAFTGRSFLPEFNEGSLTISAQTLPGTSLEQSTALGQMIEDALLEFPEVVATARRTGRGELAEHTQDVNSTEVEATLDLDGGDKEDFLAALRERLASVPGMSITIGQPISHRIDHMLSGTRANIAVKIFGDDLYTLRNLAQAVRAQMAEVNGVVDLNVEQQVDIPMLTIDIDRRAIARHGLSVGAVATAIETAFYGSTLTRVLEGQASFDLILRYPPEQLKNLDAVRDTLITTADGALLPLKALADIRRARGPNTISREDVQRKIVVSANVAGRDLASVVDEIRATVQANVAFPAGYHLEYGGQFESAASAMRTLLIVGAGVIVGVFLLLYTAFHSVRDAALVMLNLPLALIGGVAGVFVSGGVLSVASIVGFITLFGIATRNGVMMISHIHHLADIEAVDDAREAVLRGAMERVLPILMTALSAGLALVPLALSGGLPGSEIQTPMAIVILFGLLSSTALNMIVVPALYLRYGSRAR
ncbi:MAG TPA: efflux RND transporter permease subunit [Thioalkalivibrio sp.]|nr:efflux RND transporter permease subunit [Thioalkalivibrio sp.]